ncbi:hypothetical protein PPACK8108_LOCUS2057 [Phakopsora pachyrhizi]|uniref:CCHC-type domain-containing protein n=1 Tax=Phakopsora pachyrhizi TaxID=170000 RepID=A0AAV0AH03_PHAPC|nr:hypothetical protein PPACK8108_LOCUS2057 [Phakopsora pachyrhizi]
MAIACPKAGVPSCYNCGGQGHISKECSSAPIPKSCYSCGFSGHIVSHSLSSFCQKYTALYRLKILI